MQNENIRRRRPVTFQFHNIGPVKNAKLGLGDLTIISGRNNTGKTYIAYTLYGFLKMWKAWPEAHQVFQRTGTASAERSDIEKIVMHLRREGVTSFPINKHELATWRIDLMETLCRDFSKFALSQVFSSQVDDFRGASISVVRDNSDTDGLHPTPARFALTGEVSLSIEYDTECVVMKLDKPKPRSMHFDLTYDVSRCYVEFLLRDLLPTPFILSAERFGISLFYRELDFTKNQLIDMLQKMGEDKNRERFSPYLLIDRATSRYALPIKDNIDYTRSIPNRRRDKSEFVDTKLSEEIKKMMGGYYGTTGDEIRFISKARGKGRSFNIPLHLASSSARGLSDLFFFLRHVAKNNDLLIIDEPESHLDTENQILLARLLSRFVQSGLKVLVTTHSDYLLKEINNLIMLSQIFEGGEAVFGRSGYVAADALDPALVRAYMAEEGRLTQCSIDRFGIDMPIFDTTIDKINATANELASHLERVGAP